MIKFSQSPFRVLCEKREHADDLCACIAASPPESREVPLGQAKELFELSLRDFGGLQDLIERSL